MGAQAVSVIEGWYVELLRCSSHSIISEELSKPIYVCLSVVFFLWGNMTRDYCAIMGLQAPLLEHIVQ